MNYGHRSDSATAFNKLAWIYRVSRWALAGIFFYHGLIPKLLFRADQEIEMNEVFLPWASESFALISSGIAEILFAGALLVWFKARVLNYLIILFGITATIAIAIFLPHLFTAAFNPFTTNLALVVLAWINAFCHGGAES